MILFSKAIWQLRDFQKSFNSTYNDYPTPLPKEELELRNKLFREEFKEFVQAKDSLVEQADALIDMAYISFGDLVCLGEYESPSALFSDTNGAKQAIERLAYLSYLVKIDRKIIHERLFLIMKLLSVLGLSTVAGELFNEVHRSNMSKLDKNGKPVINDGIINPNLPVGKILKSEGYSKPDLKSIIENANIEINEIHTI